MADPAGLTEPVIFARIPDLHGIEYAGGLFQKFAQAQAAGYSRHADDIRKRGRVLPGAVEALRQCHEEPGVVSTVLTGNPRPCAIAKLQIFELDQYLDLNSGAYGDDDADRAALVRIAWSRAGEQHRKEFLPGNTMIVGDTPNDLAAAQAKGVFAVAVRP